jgi:uncharacterized protein
MKIILHEIKEKASLDFTYDYHKEIEHIEDILSIKPANIHVDINFDDDSLILDFNVKVDMELACSKTLKPIPYHMDISENVIFGNQEDADFILTNEIELSDIIFGYIISEKPYTIYHPDAKELLFEEEKSPHPAFADLDKLLKK